MSSNKVRVIFGLGGLSAFAMVAFLFMWLPNTISDKQMSGELAANMVQIEEQPVPLGYFNTLNLHMGQVIVSCDVAEEDKDVCLNAIKQVANDTVALYIHGLESDGVHYTTYSSVNKIQKSGVAKKGANDYSWQETIASRVVEEDESDRIQFK